MRVGVPEVREVILTIKVIRIYYTKVLEIEMKHVNHPEM